MIRPLQSLSWVFLQLAGILETMKKDLLVRLLAIFFFRLLLNSARRFAYPFAPLLSRSLEVPLAAITSILAAGQFTAFLGIFSGPLADRLGNRLVMRAGLALVAAGMLFCSLSLHYYVVFVGLLLASLGKTVFDPAIQSYVGSQTPYHQRGRAIGLLETAWAGSTLIGIPTIGLLIHHGSLQIAFITLSLLGAFSWLAIAWVIPKDGEKKADSSFLLLGKSIFALLKNPLTAGMLIFGFLISIANDSLFVVYGSWFEASFAISLVGLGASTIAIGCAELAGEGLTAILADRIGGKKLLYLAIFLASLAYLLLPLIGQNLGLAMVGMFILFLFFELTMVTSFSICTELQPRARATMMAGYYASGGLGRMIGVVVGGLLWQGGGIKLVCLVACLVSLAGLGVAWWSLRKWQP